MKSRWGHIVEMLESSFWLPPFFISAFLMSLVPILGYFEIAPSSPIAAFLISAESANGGAGLILSSIATASMTVVGVLFSITIVVLQQVSSQFTPRVIENFIRSLPTQIVMGFYVGTFGYCILYLRKVPDAGFNAPPELTTAVGLAIVLALICLALLIYYIQHIAKSIKSNNILAAIAKKATLSLNNIREDFQSLCSLGEESRERDRGDFRHRCEVKSCRSGYLQEVDLGKFINVLDGMGWSAKIIVMAGEYIHDDMPLATVCSDAPLDERVVNQVRESFHIHLLRTHSQDPVYGIKLMSDIALRALSPAVNDPSTAIEAINEIGTVLIHFTKCHTHGTEIAIANGCLLDVKNVSFDVFLGHCFDQITLSGREFAAVLVRIRAVLAHCKTQTADANRIAALSMKETEIDKLLADLRQVSPINLSAVSG